MEALVEGCMNCPMFQIESVCGAFCCHPAHTDGKKYIPVYAELRDDYFLHWCPLIIEPLTISIKPKSTTPPTT